jgi:exoenzyme U
MAGEDDAIKRVWMADALGVIIPERAASAVGAGGPPTTLAPADPHSAISQAALKPEIWSQKIGSALSSPPGAKLSAPITSPIPVGPKTRCIGKNGRKVEIEVGPDGRVAMTRDRPPVREVTFSGGGGKGAALPGAVAALEQSGVLKDARELHGASIGSATAAILASGVSADEFTELGDKLGPVVQSEKLVPIKMTGDSLENFVRDAMSKSVQGKIQTYLDKAHDAEPAESGDPPADPNIVKTLQEIQVRLAKGGGVTFGDLRTLSKIIPDIKEAVISGTMMGDDSGPSGKIEKGVPQLAIFSADTEPDLDVARAVHASAALPPVFKPVDIKLSSGVTARFEDGGVMNNAPTRATVGDERQVDPMTDQGSMTFVFEEEASKEILAGTATPSKSRLVDFIAGANMSAADYAKNRTLADKPEDVVMVPLKIDGPWYKHTDFSGMMGLLDFNMAKGPKQKLRSMTKDATLANIKKRQEPETKTFGSVDEMLNSASEADLAAMADNDFPGAKDELAFRKSVKDGVAALEAVASGAKAESLQAGPVKNALAALAALAGDDKNRQAFVGREMNRSGRLDPLLDVAKQTGNAGFKILEAGVAVSEALEAHNHAQTILREMIYPKMVDESPTGAGGTVLRQVDTILRSATSKDDVNRALSIAINHFAAKSDTLDYHGHHAFAAKLKTYVMK